MWPGRSLYTRYWTNHNGKDPADFPIVIDGLLKNGGEKFMDIMEHEYAKYPTLHANIPPGGEEYNHSSTKEDDYDEDKVSI